MSETIKNPTTELNYSDEFTLLVAVVLSAQSTDKGVNKVTTKLFNLAKKPSEMAKLGEKKIRETIKNIGLYNSKAKNLFLLSNMLINEHEGKVPSERDALVKLPGVGRKTANVVLNTFFDKGLTIKSRYLCLYLFSISDKPCHLSGSGCNDLDNISHFDTFIESSPLLVFLIVP